MADKVIPVKVALRIRPLNQREKNDACTECIRTISGEPQVILGKDKPFTYDYVFSQNTPQIDIYEASVKPLIDALFKGYNATVLAYGQTGSGKTFTMGSGYAALSSATATLTNSGDNQNVIMNLNDLDEVGVIPRVLNDLFTRIEDEQNSNKDQKFFVKVSFVEVYNEEIKDLFNLKGNQEPLNIREENNTIRVVNLSEIEVKNSITTIQLLEKGSSGRVVGGTAMNDQSSRSHAIFTITLEQTNTTNQSVPNAESSGAIKSKFHLVDLAGSERQSKTKAEGLRLKEGININLGLLALGNVISVLGEDNPGNKIKHVPYRESKLTRLLQDSLGGNSHTVMIACVSPADSNMEETLNTLRYADRARKIKNKPIVNIDPQAAELTNLRQQVQELKAHIYQLTGGTGVHPTPANMNDNSADLAHLKEENDFLKKENNKLMFELQRITISNRATYERYMQLETEREDQKKKFEEIKTAFEKMVREAEENATNTSQPISLDQTIAHNKTILSELQNKMQEFEQIKKERTEIIPDAEMPDINEPIEKDYALRQARMQCQLSEYDTELAKKEVLFQKMIENNLNTRFEANIEELKHKIDDLEKEKEDLLDMIRNSESKKQAELKRDRLKQLEVEVMDLKRREKDFQRMVKLKEENEKHCEKLRQEIQNIKSERVKLIKQMRSDTDSFRKFRQEKEKEVNQLKAVERKRLVEISKLQEGNNRQEAVLKRKNEEITRIQKQLRETLEKQKQVAEKRQQNFDRKDSSHLGEKLRNWVTQELDLSVDIAVARINLNKLIEERKESAAELKRLEEKMQELEEIALETPGYKRKFNGFSDEEFESPTQLQDKIERLKEDIEGKSLQINEIQQMVIDGEQEDRSKYIFNTVHGLLEAKVLLKHLYNSGVQYLLDSKLKQIQYETTTNSLNQELKDLKKKCDSIEEELTKTKKNSSREFNDLQRYYEEKLLIELKTSLNDMTKTEDERYNIIYETLQTIEKRFENSSHVFTEPLPVKKREIGDMTNKEDFRRVQKAKKDHRRTRVIYKVPEVDPNLVDTSKNFSNSSSINNMTINYDSKENIFDTSTDSSSVQDDNIADPDWSKTPLFSKRTRRTITKKPASGRRSRMNRISSSLADTQIAESNETFNLE